MKSKDKQKGIESHSSFFALDKQRSYQSQFKVFGQMNEDSCVAATTKMLLADSGIQQPEAFISAALEMNNGAYLFKVPAVLQDFGLKQKFKWRNDLTFDELEKAVKKGKAIVSIKHPDSNYRHAVIVDGIFKDEVQLRILCQLAKVKAMRFR